jgi:hypothetical protein
MSIVMLCFCLPAISQSTSNETLMSRTRALYDAPFTRDLVSFDCAVQFDWKEHFVEILGKIPPAAEPTAERLQTIQHRVFVDRSGAVVSAIPKAPDLTGVNKAAELEQIFNLMISNGLNAWLPSSMNVILPVEPTTFGFEKIQTGYKLAMSGPGVDGTLLLATDMRITSGVMQQPQPMRFTTAFMNGPSGFLLTSITTGNTTDATTGEAKFEYTYQTVEGFEIPSTVTVTPSTTEAWRYALTGCKAMKGIVVKVGLPRK